jgi:hypothetical protein
MDGSATGRYNFPFPVLEKFTDIGVGAGAAVFGGELYNLIIEFGAHQIY